MDESLIGPVHDLALSARELLVTEARGLLEGVYGLPRQSATLPAPTAAVSSDPELLDTNRHLKRWLEDEVAAGLTPARAYEKLVKEIAFTHLNRGVAFKMMEARRLIRGTLDRGYDSNGFKFYLASHDDDLARYEAGDTPRNAIGEGPRDTAYRHFLLWQAEEMAKDVASLFDPDDLPSRLFPRPPALSQLLALLNAPALTAAWLLENDETIGWVYQYFNETEKKEVFARLSQKAKFQPEDIPAATQLFTPRWIVRFLVHNSLGRMWLQMHPDSGLADELDALLPLPVAPPPLPLKPVSEISVMDPACGTMHFGLVAFDLLAAMYREELAHAGEPDWPAQASVSDETEIASAIIANNLFGIDIDLRAVQLSALTLYFKAKSLNPQSDVRQSNLACADVLLLNGARLDAFLQEMGFSRPIYERLLKGMWDKLGDASIAGSLVRADSEMRTLIAAERARYEREGRQGDFFGDHESLFEQDAAAEEFWSVLEAQLQQAFDEFARREDGAYFAGEATKGMRVLELLLRRYDVVVTNPPYGSSGNVHERLADYLKRFYSNAKGDLYAAFMVRCCELLAKGGRLGMITQQSFMFLSSYEKLRISLLEVNALEAMAHLGPRAFESIGGEVVNTTMFVLRRESNKALRNINAGRFVRLVRESSAAAKQAAFASAASDLRAGAEPRNVYAYHQRDFDGIPGEPWVYWITEGIRSLFSRFPALSETAEVRQGLATADNPRFLRYWWEVGLEGVKFDCGDGTSALESGGRWFPMTKGGTERRWWGNHEHVVNWHKDGSEMKEHVIHSYPYLDGKWQWVVKNSDYYFRQGVTWSRTGSARASFRYTPPGFVFDAEAPTAFVDEPRALLPVLNSSVAAAALALVNPTIHFQVGDVVKLPVPANGNAVDALIPLTQRVINLARQEGTEDETTFEFVAPSIWSGGLEAVRARQRQLGDIEREIDEAVYRLYGIGSEDRVIFESELGVDEAVAESTDSNEGNSETEEQEASALTTINRQTLARRWASYAVGIVLGRFQPGVKGALGSGIAVEADGSENHAFVPVVEAGLVKLAAADGVAVLEDGSRDDLPTRVEQALELMVGEEGVAEIAVALSGDAHALRQTLRRYLERDFFKWHLSLYRKRPVYWLLQSPGRNYGVYLFHERITRDTLFLLQGNRYLGARRNAVRQQIEELAMAIAGAEGSAKRQLERERERAVEVLADLDAFAERLQNVTSATNERGETAGWELELDDGVLLNVAPLHSLIPAWSGDPKKAWHRLEQGDFDWSFTARRYWPDRVAEKCRTNKSYAIAHQLEHLYEGSQ